MRSVIFVDTSGFFAAFSENDARHVEAAAALDEVDELITSQLVVIETVSLITKRLSPFHARSWYHSFRSDRSARVREFDAATFAEAEKLWLSHRDKDWDLIDCYSFVLMRSDKIEESLTFDRHFEQAGFIMLP